MSAGDTFDVDGGDPADPGQLGEAFRLLPLESKLEVVAGELEAIDWTDVPGVDVQTVAQFCDAIGKSIAELEDDSDGPIMADGGQKQYLVIETKDRDGWYVVDHVDLSDSGDLLVSYLDGRQGIVKRDHWAQAVEYTVDAIRNMFEDDMFAGSIEQDLEKYVFDEEGVEA